MIVVAVIALLAAIAIPQYQNYVLKSQMTRAYSELNTLRVSVEVCENDGQVGGTCELDTFRSDMLITAPTVAYNPSSITATFGERASPRLHGGTIIITRSNTGSSWACSMTVPNVPQSLIPKACQ